jgi:hypothetical protein
MARRYAVNPDYLQSVPYRSKGRKAKDRAAMRPDDSSAHQGPANAPEAPATPRTTPRQHMARTIGAATLASVLAIALYASPGENPRSETLAKNQTIADNGVIESHRARKPREKHHV